MSPKSPYDERDENAETCFRHTSSFSSMTTRRLSCDERGIEMTKPFSSLFVTLVFFKINDLPMPKDDVTK